MNLSSRSPKTSVKTVFIASCVSGLLLCTGHLSGQTQIDTILLILQQPNCSEKIADKVECSNLAGYLMRDLEDFYSPILNENDRATRIRLFEKMKAGVDRPGEMKTASPAGELIVYFNLSPSSLEVKVVDLATEVTDAYVNVALKNRRSPRKDVELAAGEVIRQIVKNRYGIVLGQTSNLRLRLPPDSRLKLPNDVYKSGRWRTVRLTRQGQLYYLEAERDEKKVRISPLDLLRSNPYYEWKVTESDSGNVRMRPIRTSVTAGTGLSSVEGKTLLNAGLGFNLLVSPRLSLRAGGNYFVLPRQTQVEPLPDVLAQPLSWKEGVIIPYVGLGGHFSSDPLGLRYGFNLDGFFAPVYWRTELWVSVEKIPWLRLSTAFQQIRQDVDLRVFDPVGVMATTSNTERTYSFPSVSLIFYRTL